MKAALVPLCIYTEVFTATIRNKNTGATYARVVGNFRQQCVTGTCRRESHITLSPPPPGFGPLEVHQWHVFQINARWVPFQLIAK